MSEISCKFCNSPKHLIKDTNGIILCPVLKNKKCKFCNESGHKMSRCAKLHEKNQLIFKYNNILWFLRDLEYKTWALGDEKILHEQVNELKKVLHENILQLDNQIKS